MNACAQSASASGLRAREAGQALRGARISCTAISSAPATRNALARNTEGIPVRVAIHPKAGMPTPKARSRHDVYAPIAMARLCGGARHRPCRPGRPPHHPLAARLDGQAEQRDAGTAQLVDDVPEEHAPA